MSQINGVMQVGDAPTGDIEAFADAACTIALTSVDFGFIPWQDITEGAQVVLPNKVPVWFKNTGNVRRRFVSNITVTGPAGVANDRVVVGLPGYVEILNPGAIKEWMLVAALKQMISGNITVQINVSGEPYLLE